MTTAYEMVFVRREEEPVLAPPPGQVGIVGWLRRNLFSSITNAVITLLAVAFLVWLVPPIIRWAFVNAVWTGSDRTACLAPEAGACWPFVTAKFAQFMYGSYSLDQRWRVDLTAVLLVLGLIPLAIPRVPFKRETIVYVLGIFPVVALVLLTGGHFSISLGFIAILFAVGCIGTAAIAVRSERRTSPLLAGVFAPIVALLAVLIFAAMLILKPSDLVLDLVFAPTVLFSISIGVALDIAAAVLALIAGLAAIFARRASPGRRSLLTLWTTVGALIILCFAVRIDFGLAPVETPLWGGLLVTLVVAIVGIVASLPIGILLALGRRSQMPVVRFLSITLIEFVRGVPLITVLFMASVMLPVFLPPGVTFDKLLRALIGVAIFSSAYMAEVIRGGLQAIPRGQYEAARAMGLGYWQMMRLIVLPQALRIVIPGIVNSFISLFKDTSLVLIIGIYDLLGIVQRGFNDQNWSGPNVPATGYAFAALIFWAFCFGMSRYSIYTERRLHTGHRRR
jgi:general L-amino acid transport system permease protein